MLLIPCPWCGERARSEFSYGGDGTLERPGGDEPFGEAWTDYVYRRDNPRGLHLEFWYHHYGCRRWFRVLRETESNEIRAAGRDLEHPGGRR